VRKKIALGMLTVALITLTAACGQKAAQEPARPEARAQTVSVARVERGDLSAGLTTSGKISPVEEVKVVPKSSGKVARVLADVGQVVSAGDLLLEMDNSDIKARLDSARASLAVSQANLEKARLQLEKSGIQMEDAKRALERKKALFDAGAISLADYEAAKSSFETVQKDVDMNAAGLAASQAGVEQSLSSLRQSEVDLENSQVRSPISGVISTRSINAGEFATNSTPAMVVVNISTVEVSAGLLEDQINYVRQGQEVEVLVSAVSPAPVKGRVAKIGLTSDQKTKTYPFWVAIDNRDSLLKPGMFAEIKLAARKREGVLTVPAEAVLDRGGRKVVYLAQADKAVERKVAAGVTEGGKTEITEGLSGGETVITSGLSSMKDGLEIKVQNKSN